MKKLILLISAVIFTSSVFAQNTPKTGYKGFFDFGYVFDLSDYEAGRLELTTTHGYQFNPYIFAGAGIGYNYYTEGEAHAVPIFANIRVTPLNSSITPYIDAKLGYSVADIDGLYFSPSIGCRFGLNERIGINIGLGYSLQQAEVWYYDFYYEDIYTEKKVISGLNLKIGIDF